jgi:hypothetical protein
MADHGDHVAKKLLARPLAERLIRVLRKAEVDGAGEVLARSVEPASREQLTGSDQPETFLQLPTYSVLAGPSVS